MKFALTLEISKEVLNKSALVDNLSRFLTSHLGSKNYGKDVESFLIGCICMSPKFEFFCKPRRRRYEKLEKYVHYDIVLDFDTFNTKSDKEICEHIFQTIYESKNQIETLKSKINFDFDELFQDIKNISDSYIKENIKSV